MSKTWTFPQATKKTVQNVGFQVEPWGQVLVLPLTFFGYVTHLSRSQFAHWWNKCVAVTISKRIMLNSWRQFLHKTASSQWMQGIERLETGLEPYKWPTVSLFQTVSKLSFLGALGVEVTWNNDLSLRGHQIFRNITHITSAYMLACGFLTHGELKTLLVSELMNEQMKCEFCGPHFNVANMTALVSLGISRNQEMKEQTVIS